MRQRHDIHSLSRRSFVANLTAMAAGLGTTTGTRPKEAKANMFGDPLGTGGGQSADSPAQFLLWITESILGLAEMAMQAVSDKHTRQARSDRAQAQMELDTAVLQAIEFTVTQNSDILQKLESLEEAVRELGEGVTDSMEQILTQHDDLQRSISIVAAYQHFLQHRQELLQRADKWNDRAAVGLYGNEVRQMRLSLQYERLELQGLWSAPHISPQRLATMAVVLTIELEMDAELEALGLDVNSAPSIKNMLEWFDGKRLKREIEMLAESVADLEEAYQDQMTKWNKRYSPIPIVGGHAPPIHRPVEGHVLSNGVEAGIILEGVWLGDEGEWLNASERIVKENTDRVTCVETLHPTHTWLIKQRWESPYSADDLAELAHWLMMMGRRVDHECEWDTRETEQYAQVVKIRAFRNLASIHLAQRRFVHDTINAVSVNAREILAMERNWPDHWEPDVQNTVTADVESLIQDATRLTLSLDGGLRFD